MNIRTSFLSAAIVAVLNCTSAEAQVLGGNVGGAIGGTVSGGMRDVGAMTRGGLGGSIGADIGTGSLRRTTLDAAGRTTNRVRGTAAAGRNRAESTVSSAHDTSVGVAGVAAATATQAVSTQHVETATGVAGSAASVVNANGTQLTSAAEGAASQEALINPSVANQSDAGALPSLSGQAAQEAGIVQSAEGRLTDVSESPQPDEPNERSTSPRSLTTGAALSGDANGSGSIGSAMDDAPLSASGDASGSGSGNASASRKGVSAQGSAQGNASADVAANH